MERGVFMVRAGWFLSLVSGMAMCAELPICIRGARDLLFDVAAGPLRIELLKRDFNMYAGEDRIRAELFDPAHRPVGTLEIPDDGNAEKGGGHGDVQTAALDLMCTTSGVYRMRVSGVGSDFTFGMRTSCERYLVKGRMTFHRGDLSRRVYFLPPEGAFAVTAHAFHEPGIQTVTLHDAADAAVATFDLQAVKEDVTREIAAQIGDRTGAWSMDVGRMDVVITVSGVPYWTLSKEALFMPEDARWVLGPWKSVRYLEAGDSCELTTYLHNRSGHPLRCAVSVQSDAALSAGLTSEPLVTVGTAVPAPIKVLLTLGQEAVRGTVLTGSVTTIPEKAPDERLSADFEIRVGTAPVGEPLVLPIVHSRYRHENDLFGYAPEYPAGPVYFDHENRPYLLGSRAITVLEDGQWHRRSFIPALKEAVPDFTSTKMVKTVKVVFDEKDGALFAVFVRREAGPNRSMLLYTPDRGRTFQVLGEAPAYSYDFEQFTGHNDQAHPRLIGYETRATHPAKWTAYKFMRLFFVQSGPGGPRLGEPILVSDSAAGGSQHSGGPSAAATRNGRTHVAWIEPTPPDEDVPGMPTFVATIDHASGAVGPKTLLAYSIPANDGHNHPAICQDSDGYLHVLTGAHGANFFYLRSLVANDSTAGWTKPEKVLTAGWKDDGSDADGRGRQTYASLVCDPEDTLHIAFRQWRRGVDRHHPGSYCGALSYQRKPKGGGWSPARPMVIPAVPGYSIYYHKLTVDRRGTLYLAYEYYSGEEHYRYTYLAYNPHRAVLVSRDGGDTWKLAETADFAEGMR